MTAGGTPARTRGTRTPPDTSQENPCWAVFSYLLGGMIFYGGLGWVIGHWVWHSALPFPLGMVAGLSLSIVLIILRYGRSDSAPAGKS